jgi:hypothetical protein
LVHMQFELQGRGYIFQVEHISFDVPPMRQVP